MLQKNYPAPARSGAAARKGRALCGGAGEDLQSRILGKWPYFAWALLCPSH